MSQPAWWFPERLMPLLLALMVAIDAGCRFLPVEWFAVRPWEAVTSQPAPGAPFRPSYRFTHDRAYGDLALLGNWPALRHYRKEVFTTDAHGFRQTPGGLPPAAIVVGDSFTAGFGVCDEETLPAQLARVTGRGFYNAGGRPMGPNAIIAIADRLGLREGLVLYQLLERDVAPSVPRETEASARPSRRYQLMAASAGLWGPIERYLTYSPVQILAGRAFRRLLDDTILPNQASRRVEVRRLRNGASMLFYPLDLRQHRMVRATSGAYFSWLAAKLAPRRLRLAVVLVPNKYSVYSPLLAVSEPSANAYMAAMSAAIAKERVPVLNLGPLLQSRAASALAEERTLYWPDDTHWNREGIAISARAIARWLDEGHLQPRIPPPRRR